MNYSKFNINIKKTYVQIDREIAVPFSATIKTNEERQNDSREEMRSNVSTLPSIT